METPNEAKNPATTVGGQLVRQQSDSIVSNQKRGVRKQLQRTSLPFYWEPVVLYGCLLVANVIASTDDTVRMPTSVESLSQLKNNEFFLIYFAALSFCVPKFMEGLLSVSYKSSSTIALICTLQYVAAAFNLLPAAVAGSFGSVGNDRMALRYITWSFTSPLMTQWLLDVIPASSVNTQNCRLAQACLVVVNLFGFLGVALTDPTQAVAASGAAGVFFLGWAFFVRPLFHALGQHTLTGPEDSAKMYQGTVLLWCSFPVIYYLGFAKVLSPFATELGLVFCDLATKVIFSSMMFNQLSNLRAMNDEMVKALDQAEQHSATKIANMHGFMRVVLKNLRPHLSCVIEGMDGINRELVKSKIQESGELTLDLVSASVNQASSLVEMTLLQLNRDDFSMEKKPINVLKFVDDCIKNMSMWATQRNISIELSPVLQAVPQIIANNSFLWRALLNFISNAIKFSPGFSTITINVKLLDSLGTAKANVDQKLVYALGKEVGDTQRENEDLAGQVILFLSVRDGGSGISAAHLGNIFELDGDGAGLSATCENVKTEGGVVGVKTLPKVGSEFYLAVPFRVYNGTSSSIPSPEEAVEAVPVKASVSFTKTLNILVVDDYKTNRALLKRLLVRRGFNVEEADDGTSCLEMVDEAGKDYYSAILMDGTMPKMSGRECTLKLRELGHMIPVYGVSGFADAEDVESFNAAGATRMMAKPANINELCSWLSLDLGITIKDKPKPKTGLKRRKKPKAKADEDKA